MKEIDLPDLSSKKLGVQTLKTNQLKNYEKAIDMLDDSIEDALQVIIDGLKSRGVNYRFRCAELLIRKVIPDKKVKEHTGKDGNPIQIEAKIDNREAILHVVAMLDEMIIDELENKKVSDDGSARILEAEYRTESEEKKEVGESSGDNFERRRSRREKVERESVESSVSPEEEQRDGRIDGASEEGVCRARRREN